MYTTKSNEKEIKDYAEGKTVNVFAILFSNHETIMLSHMTDCEEALASEDYIIVADIYYVGYTDTVFTKGYKGNENDPDFHEIACLIETASHTDTIKIDEKDINPKLLNVISRQ